MVRRSGEAAALLAVLVLAACGGDDDAIQPGARGGDMNFGNAPPVTGSLPGTSGGSSGGNAGASAGGPIRNVCPDGQVRTTRATPRVILVLDGSCSMSTPYPTNGALSAMACSNAAGTRWASLRDALVAPGTGVVTRLSNVVEFGVVVYGTQNQCPVPGTPVDPALGNLAAIEGAMPQGPPGMFTPTGLALDWVHDNMIIDIPPDGEFQPQIVVLATDGEPNSCDDWTMPSYQASVDAVTRIQGRGVQTYVISLADATGEFHDHLQQLANIGSGVGSGILYQPANPEQLAADLEILVGGAIGCDLALNGEVLPGAECSGTVTLSSRTLDCGSDYVVTDARHITLMGQACEDLKNTPDALLVADFPCDSFQVD